MRLCDMKKAPMRLADGVKKIEAAKSNANNEVIKHLKNVSKTKADYDTAKVLLHSKLAPTRQLLQHIDQTHPLNDSGGVGGDMEQQDDLERTGQMQRPQPGRGMPGQEQQQPGQGMKQQQSGGGKMNNMNVNQRQGSGGRPAPSTSGDKPKQPGPKQPTGSNPAKGKDPAKKQPAKKVSVKVYGGTSVSSISRHDPRNIRADYHDDAGVSMPTRAIGGAGKKCMKCMKKGLKACSCNSMKAGGPGSGRRPEGKGGEPKDYAKRLSNLHDQLSGRMNERFNVKTTRGQKMFDRAQQYLDNAKEALKTGQNGMAHSHLTNAQDMMDNAGKDWMKSRK